MKRILIVLLAATSALACQPPTLSLIQPTPGSITIQALHVSLAWTSQKAHSFTVFRNGEVIAMLSGNVHSYTDWQPEANNVYAVTANMACGTEESNEVIVHLP